MGALESSRVRGDQLPLPFLANRASVCSVIRRGFSETPFWSLSPPTFYRAFVRYMASHLMQETPREHVLLCHSLEAKKENNLLDFPFLSMKPKVLLISLAP